MISYANVVDTNIKDILKLKNSFPNLLAKKIEEIYKIVKDQNKHRLRINIITKGLSCCQIIIPICIESITKIMAKLSKHVTNINHLLKNIKLNIVADFIWADSNGIIVTTNSITIQSDLNLIKKYIKDIDIIQANTILIFCLSQSRSYLKILNIPYIDKTTSTPINSGIVETSFDQHMFSTIYVLYPNYILSRYSLSQIWP